MSTPLTTEAEIRAWAALRRLPDAHLERWLALEEPDRAALLEAARRLRLRTGQFVTALELLEEIAVRDPKQGNVAIVIAQDSIRQIFDGAGSVPERAHAFLEERIDAIGRNGDGLKGVAQVVGGEK